MESPSGYRLSVLGSALMGDQLAATKHETTNGFARSVRIIVSVLYVRGVAMMIT